MAGFCLINNVVMGLTHARLRWGIRRVAVVDIDAHFGNGTAEMLRHDPEAFFGSVHLYRPQTSRDGSFFPGECAKSEIVGDKYVSVGIRPAPRSEAVRNETRIEERQSQLKQGLGGQNAAHQQRDLQDSNKDQNEDHEAALWSAVDRDHQQHNTQKENRWSQPGIPPLPERDLVAPAGFRTALQRYIIPALRHFQPELVLISAGFDGMASDPLGGQLGLVVEDYAWATRQIVRAAETMPSCRGRLVSVLEGGYDIQKETGGLAQAAQAHVRELMKVGHGDV